MKFSQEKILNDFKSENVRINYIEYIEPHSKVHIEVTPNNLTNKTLRALHFQVNVWIDKDLVDYEKSRDIRSISRESGFKKLLLEKCVKSLGNGLFPDDDCFVRTYSYTPELEDIDDLYAENFPKTYSHSQTPASTMFQFIINIKGTENKLEKIKVKDIRPFFEPVVELFEKEILTLDIFQEYINLSKTSKKRKSVTDVLREQLKMD